jgi:UDP-2-acetamido-2-deoxy-ribo-hexuluronate aminotransferase
MEVPYANLNRIYQESKAELDKAVQDCVDNSWFIKGPKVVEFENNLSDYCGVPAVGVSSGTSALLLAYECLGLRPGDKVIIPSFTFISTPEMASKLGFEIVWVDCDKDNYTMNTDELAGILSSTKDIKAIIGVDIFGHTCDWDTIKDIAGEIPVVQDAAQSFGGKYKGRINGTYNDLTCFSFYPAKNMWCFGDGGAVVGNQNYIDKISMSRDHGRTDKYVHEFLGWNERLDSVQANVLNHMITKIDSHNEDRRRIASIYDKELNTDTMVKTADWCENVYNQYTVQVRDRSMFQNKLQDFGIHTGVMWPLGCHAQPVYNSKVNLKNTEHVADTVLSLPCWPLMTDDEIGYVIEKFNSIS